MPPSVALGCTCTTSPAAPWGTLSCTATALAHASGASSSVSSAARTLDDILLNT
jgi:hypothetical protein